MKELIEIQEKGIITSLELLKQINFFRKQEGNRVGLKHYDLLKIIRDEFEEEISLGKISQSTYKNDRGREYPMFELTFNQAREILVRESKYVRKAVIKYIEHLEEQTKRLINLQEQQYIMKLTERLNNLEKMLSSMTLDTTKMTIKKYMATRGISNNINTSIMANKAVTVCKKHRKAKIVLHFLINGNTSLCNNMAKV